MMVKMIFETFGVAKLLIVMQPVLDFRISGKTTGLVVNIGDEITQVVPIIDGQPLLENAQTGSIAGKNIVYYFSKLLTYRGYSFTTQAEYEILYDMKHKMSYVAFDVDEEEDDELIYELPDGQTICIGRERYLCSETLFDPSLYNDSGTNSEDSDSLQGMCVSAIMRCEPKAR